MLLNEELEVCDFAMAIDVRAKWITSLLNGTQRALRTVVPIDSTISKPKLDNDLLLVKYGVFIGITGDIKGKLVLMGEEKLFSRLGEVMFGMEVDGDMLLSFSGEFGNMVAGNLSTFVVQDGYNINITTPSIIKGNAKVAGHQLGIQLVTTFEDLGDMYIHLLLDE